MRHALRLAHHGDYHVSVIRCLDRFVNHCLRRTLVNLNSRLVLVKERNNIFVVGDVCAFRKDDFPFAADGIFDPGQNGHGLVTHPSGRPAAHHVTLAVGQRPHHGNGGRFFQRQRLQAVFQQHHAFARHFPRLFAVQAALGVGVLRIALFRAKVAIGIVEQPHIVFDVQHVARGVIQLVHGDFAALDQPRQVLAVVLIGHAHIDARLDRHTHRILWIRGRTVFD